MDRPLEHFAKMIRGVTFAKSEGSSSPADGLLPVIRAGSIQSELLVDKDQIWIPQEKIRDDQLIQKDDIVMCTSSGSASLVGKCAKAERDWNGSFGAFCAVIRPRKETCDPSFLYHYLSSPRFRIWSTRSSGANIKNIRSSELAQFPVPDVSLPEQKRIAAILDKAYAVRRKRQQAIELGEQFIRSVFLELFGDPVTNPKGWPKAKFGDLGRWGSGGTPSRQERSNFDGEIDWYSAGELNSRYLDGSRERISSDALKNSSAKLFPSGSMLLGMYDTAAFKASILTTEASANQACANITPSDLIEIEWFYSFVQLAKNFYLSNRRGVRQKNLNLGMIKNFDLPLPPIELQKTFAETVKTLQLTSEKMQSQGDEAEVLFLSLGQQAFPGVL